MEKKIRGSLGYHCEKENVKDIARHDMTLCVGHERKSLLQFGKWKNKT